MSTYDDAVITSEEMRQEFGLDAVLRRVAATKNRATGKGTRSTTDTPVKVARDEIEVKSEQGLMSLASVFYVWTECRVDDVILFAGQSYKITAVDVFAPAGVGLYWTATVGSGA
jgi:hypothetical protein